MKNQNYGLKQTYEVLIRNSHKKRTPIFGWREDIRKYESLEAVAEELKPFFEKPKAYVEGSKILINERNIEFVKYKEKKGSVIFTFISHPYWLRAQNPKLCKDYNSGKIPANYIHIKVQPKLNINKYDLEHILKN